MDYETGQLTLDGVPFPFYIAEQGFTVDAVSAPVLYANVTIPVLGVVTITGDDGPKVFDSEFGEVAEYARALVRRGLLERNPWLRGAA
jgi:hypothetical protein